MTPARILTLVGAVCLAPAAVLAALFFGHDPVALRASQSHTHREGDYLGAASCLPCHPDQHASWRRTSHATMNQRPGKDTVVGAFDGRKVAFFGQHAVPFQEDGKFFIDLPTKSGRRTATVALVVGSHVYQQYFEYRGPAKQELLRLPILWHILEKRWLHVNGIFLSPDLPSWDIEPAGWNANCIFCHNTGPRPGLEHGVFDSKVADLGIACESCHGPGRPHVTAMQNPATRYLGYLGAGPADLAIVHPEKLDKERAVSLCGQCHGQRLPDPISAITRYLATGPTFRSGDRLTDHVQPLGPASKLEKAGEFRLRFWDDGTPRLTAYEYQGHVASACYTRGSMTCESCHTMHGPGSAENDFLRPGMRGNQACLQCHADIGADLRAHTRHDPAGSGSQCMACHMPRMVYGVLGIHRSHKIESPDAARDFAAGRPHACTLCHFDKSPRWAGRQLRELYGERFAIPTRRKNGASIDLPDALVSLLSGDAVQRAVYAHALGRSDPAPAAMADSLVGLIATLGDAYASVRTMAWRSLRERERRASTGYAARLDTYDPAAISPGARREFLMRWFGELPDRLRGSGDLPAGTRLHLLGADLRPDLAAVSRLLNLQSTNVISIGE